MPNDENKIILEFPATNVEIELGETITFDNISGFLDAERVTYNGDSLTEKITHLENNKADTTYVNTELAKKADKTDTYSKTETDNLVSPKADKSYVDTQLQAKANASDVYGKAYIDTALSGKANVGTSYTKSEEDALLANKADKSDTYTKKQVDDIVYNILPDETASGSVANFTTSLALPIKSLEVDVNAVQSAGTPTPDAPLPISGWSEISLYQRGANLFDKTTVVDDYYINDTTGAQRYNAGDKCTDYIEIKPNASYFIYSEQTSGRWGAWYDKNKNYISGITLYGARTAPANAKYARFTVVRNGNGNVDTFSVNYPSSDTTYHAYNPNGNTEVINLGGTYYGGKLDVKTGKFLITYGKANATSKNAATYSGLSSRGVRFPSALNGSYRFARAVCNMARVVYSTNYFLGCMAVGIDNAQIYWFGIIDLLGLADLDAFKTWLDNNPVEVYYELATPIEIQLTPTQVATLIGTNNIYADTGDTSVVFKNSVNGYVENKIASVQALALNT